MDKKLEEALVKGIAVSNKQTDKIFTDQFILTAVTDPKRMIDLRSKLNGPASFVRIISSGVSQLFFRKQLPNGREDTEQRYWEGLAAGVALNVTDESITFIRVVPAGFPNTITIMASRR